MIIQPSWGWSCKTLEGSESELDEEMYLAAAGDTAGKFRVEVVGAAVKA